MTSRVFRQCLLSLGPLFLLCANTVYAQQEPAIAEFTAKVRQVQNAKAISGAGAVAAHARVGGNVKSEGAVLSPKEAQGANFSDNTRIAGTTERSIGISDARVVERIGRAIRSVYTDLSTNSFDAARSFIFYRVIEDANKVATANAAPNKTLEMTTGVGNVVAARNNTLAFARAMQTVTPLANDPKKVNTAGTAIAEAGPIRAAGGGLEPAFAVSIINDPIEFTLIDPSGSGLIELVIDRDFHLDAPLLDSFASALFEFSTTVAGDPEGERALLALAIGIDYTTATIDDVDIEVLTHDPLLFPDPDAFESSLREFFVFDADLHSLTVVDLLDGEPVEEILLHQLVLAPFGEPVTLRFDYAGVVGIAAEPVPVPGAFVLLATGLAGIALRRRRASQPPASA